MAKNKPVKKNAGADAAPDEEVSVRDLGDTVETIVRTYLHPTDDGRTVSAALDRLFTGP